MIFALFVSLLPGASVSLEGEPKIIERGVEERSSLHFPFPYCQEQVRSLEGEPKRVERGVEERSSLHFSFPYCQEQVCSIEGEPKRIEEA